MHRYFLLIAFVWLILPRDISASGSVVINEVQIAGQTSKDEFVELYNASDAEIDLAGWRLTKKTATGNEANLVTTFPSVRIPARGLFLITSADYKGTASPDFSYSTGNTIADDNTVLLYRDAGDTVVDKVGFGKAADREGVAAVNPDEGRSLGRRDGVDSNDNSRDFIVAVPSPTNRSGAIGSTPPVVTPSPAPSPTSATDTTPLPSKREPPPAVVLNEVYPNPPGSDDDEFIELKNSGDASIDLGGWEVGVSRGRRFVVARGTMLAPGGVIVFDRRTTGLALENAGDVVALYQPEEEHPFFTVRYRDEAPEGQSYARSDSGKRWQWTTTRTPGSANTLTDPPMPPVLAFAITPDDVAAGMAITFDASDSFDPDREALTFAWDFGDGGTAIGGYVQHTYAYGGRYTVRLVGTTATASTTIERTLVVRGDSQPSPQPPTPPPLVVSSGTVEEGDVEDSPPDSVTIQSAHTATQKSTRNKGTSFDPAGSKEVPANTDAVARITPPSPSRNPTHPPLTVRGGEEGSPGTLRGTVLVPPGKFGKTRILLRASDTVYTAQYVRGTWPAMDTGDTITLAGRVSPSDPSRYLVREVVSVSATEDPEPEPVVLGASQVAGASIGTFAEVSGEITERHGSTVFLDDGKGEVKVQLRSSAGITPGAIQEGARFAIRGIVLEVAGEKVLVPRGLEDLTIIDVAKETPRPALPWRTVSTRNPFLYGGIMFGSALAAAGVVMMRRRRNGARAEEESAPETIRTSVDAEEDDDG